MDIDPDALAIATANCSEMDVEVDMIHCDIGRRDADSNLLPLPWRGACVSRGLRRRNVCLYTAQPSVFSKPPTARAAAALLLPPRGLGNRVSRSYAVRAGEGPGSRQFFEASGTFASVPPWRAPAYVGPRRLQGRHGGHEPTFRHQERNSRHRHGFPAAGPAGVIVGPGLANAANAPAPCDSAYALPMGGCGCVCVCV